MNVTKLTPTNSGVFLDANKDAITVLIFDAEFSEQRDIVEEATRVLQESNDLRDKVVLATVDVEANNDLATQFSVLSVPMVACVRNGKVLKKIDTLEPTKLVNIVKELLKMLELASGGESTDQSVDIKATFKDYLKKLTTRAPMMVFMKGNPKSPRCRFSSQLVELLSSQQFEYESFDILQDEEVRQGLKEYSDWPTYPQVYVKGEFIGGVDIIKQMSETGELAELKAKLSKEE